MVPQRIVPSRDIEHQSLFVSPANEGNVICIRLKNHQHGWRNSVDRPGYVCKDCGPYIMYAKDDHWMYWLDHVTSEPEISGWATSLDDAKARCTDAVLLAVLGCLEFVD